MKIMLAEAVTLDIRPGVRLSIEADGSVLLEPEAPPGEPEPPTVAKPKVLRSRPITRRASGAIFTGTIENDLLVKLAQESDRWVGFGDVVKLLYPEVPLRANGKPTQDYENLRIALRRLLKLGEVEQRSTGAGNASGRGLKAQYRIVKKPVS
jgi:hypothetical protein